MVSDVEMTGYYTMCRKEMDETHCQNPECDCGGDGPMFINQRCHPNAALEAFWYEGVVYIRCAKCERPIMKFENVEEVLDG